jgi:hypothetical protein
MRKEPSLIATPAAAFSCLFRWEYTSWIGGSIGDMGRKGEMPGTWPGTRSAPA